MVMYMKKIKVLFVDFWNNFDMKDNFFYKVLSSKYEVVISSNPDYLFYSVFGMEHKKYSCIKIFYTGECISPNFDECDYAIGFDYISFEDRYFRLPNYLRKENDIELINRKHLISKKILDEKQGFCSFCYSNKSAKERNYFFTELNKYKRVDSGGQVLNNIGYQVGNGRYDIKAKHRDLSKIEWQKKYKFCIAFENTSYRGYTTEKLPQAFAAQTIPIYWGNPLIEKEFNEKAFINCHNYSNFKEVINRIKEIDEDDDLYLEILGQKAWDCEKIESTIADARTFLINIFERGIIKARRRCKGLVHDTIKEENEREFAYQTMFNEVEEKNKFGGKLIKLYLMRMIK